MVVCAAATGSNVVTRPMRIDHNDGADNNGELPTLEQIQQTVTELAAMGLIYDTGRRRNRRIVWAAVPERKN